MATAGRQPWRLTHQMSSSTKVIGGRTYWKHRTTGLWWSHDTAGHAGSAFKVYKERANGQLDWFRDADQYGDFIDPTKKHKGPIGRRITAHLTYYD